MGDGMLVGDGLVVGWIGVSGWFGLVVDLSEIKTTARLYRRAS
jgi:hypothetical protein